MTMPDLVPFAVFVLSFLAITVLSLKKSRTVKTSDDFSVASRSLGAPGVSWVIIGTLVGGASTIGTVQMAYSDGLSAWIFTLGSGIACFLLGMFFSRALRERELLTVSEFLGSYFGRGFQVYSSAFTSLGMFVHVVGQFLASMAILQSLFAFGPVTSIGITFGLMTVFVVFGGVAGAGLVGKFKFFLLYAMLMASAGMALKMGGGLSGILEGLPEDRDMLDLFSYGNGRGLVDLGSMVVGVVSTQVYLQAIFSARDVRTARKGAFLSAAVIPPVGLLGIVVGLYLRSAHPELAGESAQALPFFLNQAFPPALSAFFSAVLLLVVLGTGAGLVLGVTTNLDVDFLERFWSGGQSSARLLRIRACSLAVLLLSVVLVFTGLDSAILRWSYLSMGLRGSAIFAGLCLVVFFKPMTRSRGLVLFLFSLPPTYLVLAWLYA
jgi:SSS family solute:Na+ symporter